MDKQASSWEVAEFPGGAVAFNTVERFFRIRYKERWGENQEYLPANGSAARMKKECLYCGQLRPMKDEVCRGCGAGLPT